VNDLWLSRTLHVLVSVHKEDVVLYSELDQLGIVGETQHLHDAVLVESNGSRSKVKNASHLLHRIAFGQQLQDISLPIREFDCGLRGYAFVVRPTVGGTASARPTGTEDGVYKRSASNSLLQESGRTICHCFCFDHGIRSHREMDNFGLRQRPQNASSGIESVQPRHSDVYQNHIGAKPLGGFQQSSSVTGDTNHFELRLEQILQSCRD
jgi:hypothetical protein